MWYSTLGKQPPLFATSPVNQTLMVGETLDYTLPTYSDPKGSAFTLLVLNQASQPILPTFVNLVGSTFHLTPTSNSEANVYIFYLNLNDGF